MLGGSQIISSWWMSGIVYKCLGMRKNSKPLTIRTPALNPWSRRLRLRRILDEAAAVLVVSEAFAAIYRRAGLANVRAVPNGLPELSPLEVVSHVRGRVRLAYLGGVAAHKGYFLLRQTLTRRTFTKLDLLVVDHGMIPGEERNELWGATPVVFTANIDRKSEFGALYGQFDVLCAPSLWPESYGLVAREALHYGKWVIAGSRGAIGEDIKPGRNGWVIDVSDPEALPQVLAEIENDPGRYIRPPALRTSGRTVAQHVSEVVEVYDAVLKSALTRSLLSDTRLSPVTRASNSRRSGRGSSKAR